MLRASHGSVGNQRTIQAEKAQRGKGKCVYKKGNDFYFRRVYFDPQNLATHLKFEKVGNIWQLKSQSTVAEEDGQEHF